MLNNISKYKASQAECSQANTLNQTVDYLNIPITPYDNHILTLKRGKKFSTLAKEQTILSFHIEQAKYEKQLRHQSLEA